jgi:multidrug efflux system membrane fusion protein
MTMFTLLPHRSRYPGNDRFRLLTAGASVVMLISLLSMDCSSEKAGKKGPRQAPASPVEVARVVEKDMPLQIRAIGNVQPYSTVEIKAQAGGPLLGVYFKEGQDVRKGDLLFKIDPRPYDIALKQAEASLVRDRAELKNAEDEVRRYAALVAKDYVTKERNDQIQVNAEVLQASVKADEAAVENARLQIEYCTVRSPIDGRTGSFLAYPGNLIRPNDTSALVVIHQTSPILVVFSVPEQNLPPIKKYMAQGPLKTEVVAKDQEMPVPGTLTFVDNGIDTATGTVQLKASFPNMDKALWPGQFLNVVLTLTVEKNVLVVPSPAVQTGQTGQFVMVLKSDMTVESRSVTVARVIGEEAVIASGLKAGETVVTDGQIRLVPGTRVEIKKTV